MWGGGARGGRWSGIIPGLAPSRPLEGGWIFPGGPPGRTPAGTPGGAPGGPPGRPPGRAPGGIPTWLPDGKTNTKQL